MGMGMKITLCAAIDLKLFKGSQPLIDHWVLTTQSIAFVISKRCIHPFHIGNEHKVNRFRMRAAQPWT